MGGTASMTDALIERNSQSAFSFPFPFPLCLGVLLSEISEFMRERQVCCGLLLFSWITVSLRAWRNQQGYYLRTLPIVTNDPPPKTAAARPVC